MTKKKDAPKPGEPNEELLARLRSTTELLEQIIRDRGVLVGVPSEERRRLLDAVGQVYHPNANARRQMVRATTRARKAERIKKEDKSLHATGIRTLRRQTVFTTPNVFPPEGFTQEDVDTEAEFREALEPQHCYVCKKKFTRLHHFYDQLCPTCAEFNFKKRTELADLRGRVALLTGGRVKIGYQAGLKLLRCGARLIVTTRFPRDSAQRYAKEPDFAEWGDRLEIFGLDLRHTPSVEAFCRELLTTRDRLDFIVNNACQTVRRPPDFYAHMMDGETAALREMPAAVRKLLGAYEGLRGYHMLPESEGTGAAVTADAGSPMSPASPTRRSSRRSRCSPRSCEAQKASVPRGTARPGPAAGGPARAELVAAADGRGARAVELLEVQLVNAVAPVHPERAAQAAACCARPSATSTS